MTVLGFVRKECKKTLGITALT